MLVTAQPQLVLFHVIECIMLGEVNLAAEMKVTFITFKWWVFVCVRFHVALQLSFSPYLEITNSTINSWYHIRVHDHLMFFQQGLCFAFLVTMRAHEKIIRMNIFHMSPQVLFFFQYRRTYFTYNPILINIFFEWTKFFILVLYI